MKVLITNDGPTAHYYIRLGLQRAFQACGIECHIHDLGSRSMFDVMDTFNPDILMTQTYNVNDEIIKCIQERPNLRVAMKASDWGTITPEVLSKGFPVLVANEKEIARIKYLKETTGQPEFFYIHYHPDYISNTHNLWELNVGIPTIAMMNAADVYDYTNGQDRVPFRTDLFFIGGYWGYKAKTLDKYILPLAERYKMKIFGNQPWPIPQYCGFVETPYVRDLMKSAKICLNVHEPHSQVYGYDIIERPFKYGINRCFVISDYVEGLKKLFPTQIAYAKTPEEFVTEIDYFLAHPRMARNLADRLFDEVFSKHTYFDRVKTLLGQFGYDLNIYPIKEKLKGKI